MNFTTTENLNSTVTYANGNLSLGNSGTGFYETFHYPDYFDYHYHYYPIVSCEKSKIEQSFKIVSKLLEKKIIKELTIGKFIELVNDISNIL